MPMLPVDVIVDILCRLPVKALLRFRCLSKQFRSIIDGPDFINRHLQNHQDHGRLIVAYQYYDRKLLSLNLDSLDNVFKLELPFEDWGPKDIVNVVGSCDGLLALSNMHQNSIGLWNISTKKHRILPRFLSGFDEFFRTKYGFGRDAATDDYKLVKIVYSCEIEVADVSVYSLKANCWRRIDGFPYCRCFIRGEAALVEGTLNWVAWSTEVEDRRRDLILSFDLKNENFVGVPPPDTTGNIVLSTVLLMVLRGCLGFVYADRVEPGCDIWVMKEYGLKDSWTKLYSFSYRNPPMLLLSPSLVAFDDPKHGDKVLIFEDDGEVFRYDLEEGKFETVRINELPKRIGDVSIYVESLVSPNVNN